ncbi:MAG: DUF3179 domain-containing protein [Chloroflexi bacterium]|nr:DUF3179 domain-containing protein [Chloroflexota bacterium]
MLRLRTIALLVTIALVAAACASRAGSASPGAGTSPDSSESPPAVGGDTTEAPDLNDLRVPTEGWSTDFSIATVDLGEFQGGGPPKDGIPSIDEPRFESIANAQAWLTPTSPVISLEVGGSARAYPMAILIWHEIVNDTLAGVPVVVTFCPLCNTALVFERTLDGTVHDFGTTGNLRFSDLVMYDRQTESWWQQATGGAIAGTLTGKKLTFLAAQIVSLSDFAAAYPDGDVLSRDTGSERAYGRNPYPGYDNANERPFLFAGEIDGRLAPKERVVTIDRGGSIIAIPLAALEAAGVIEIATAPEPVVAFWAPGTASALDAAAIDAGRDAGATGVFVPIADGQRLTFSRTGGRDGAITDTESGSTWAVTGQATSGPLAGSRLDPVVHGDHFWFAWAASQPETEIWNP